MGQNVESNVNVNVTADTGDISNKLNEVTSRFKDLDSVITNVWENEQLLDQTSFDAITSSLNDLINQYGSLGVKSDECINYIGESLSMMTDIFGDSVDMMGLSEDSLNSVNESFKNVLNGMNDINTEVINSASNISETLDTISTTDVDNKVTSVNNAFVEVQSTIDGICETLNKKMSDAISVTADDISRLHNRLEDAANTIERYSDTNKLNDSEIDKISESFMSAKASLNELEQQLQVFNSAERVSEETARSLAGEFRELDASIGANGGLISELLKGSSFHNQTQEEIDRLAQEEAQRQALIATINSEYNAWYQNQEAQRQAAAEAQALIDKHMELVSVMNNVTAGATELNNITATAGTLGSDTSGLETSTQTLSDNTKQINTNIDASVNKAAEANTISKGIDSSVTGIITGINQGLDILDKVVDAVVDISSIAEEINQTIFEMSTLLGEEVTQGVIDYTNAMQELYGLDGTTMLNQMGSIEKAVTKMGLSSTDALAVSTNLGSFANNLGALTGDFDKAFKDIATVIDKGFVGRGSALYNILSKDEITYLKNLDSEIERFNYLMSKSDRVNGVFENFLETSNGQIYLLRQSFESLKSNVAAFAHAAYSAVAPVLTKVLNGLNAILSKLMSIFNIGYEALGYEGVAESFTNSAEQIESAADSAKNSLLDFDDIISPDKSSGGASGFGDILGVDTIDTDAVSSAIEQTRTRLDELIDHFKSGWSEAWEIGQAEKALDDIKNSVDSIKKSLVNIWTDSEVQGAMKSLENQWAETAGAIVGAAQVTGLNITAGLSAGTAKWLETDSEHIKDKIIELANASTELGKQVEQAAYNFADFSTVFNDEGFISLTASLGKLGFDVQIQSAIIGNKMATAIYTGFNAIWEVSGESIKSAIDTTFGELSELMSGIDTVLLGVGESIVNNFDERIIPAAERVGKALSENIINPLVEGWENYIAPALGDLGTKLDELWTEHLQPLYETMKPVLDILTEWFLDTIEGMTMVASVIISILVPAIGGALQTAIELVINIIADLADLLRGLTDIIIGIVEGDKDRIVEGFKTVGKAVLNAVIDIINSALNTVISACNGLIGGINKIASMTDGPTLPEIPLSPIPRLATGGIVTKSTIANIGEAGAEAVVPLERNLGWVKVLAKELAREIAGQLKNSNKASGTPIMINMRECTKEYYTRSEMIAQGEHLAQCLKLAGMNVSVVM